METLPDISHYEDPNRPFWDELAERYGMYILSVVPYWKWINSSENGSYVVSFKYRLRRGDEHASVVELFLCFVLFIGFASHVLLFIITLTPKYGRYSYTIYLTFICLFDMTFLLRIFIQDIYRLVLDKTFGHIAELCKFETFMVSIMAKSCFWMTVAIAMDRYIVIVHPFKKDVWCTRRNSLIVSGSILVANGLLAILPVYYSEYDGSDCVSQQQREITTYFNQVTDSILLLFLIVITVMSVKNLAMVKRRRKAITSKQSLAIKDKTANASVALITITVLTCLQKMLGTTVMLFITFDYRLQVLYKIVRGNISIFLQTTEIINSLKYTPNFFILVLLNGRFRRDLMQLFRCRWNFK